MTGEQLNKTLTDARPSIRDIFRLQKESDIENTRLKIETLKRKSKG